MLQFSLIVTIFLYFPSASHVTTSVSSDNIFSWKEIYINYGTVMAFGKNNHGQLSLGDDDHRYVPTQIPGIHTDSVSCVFCYTLIRLNL